MTPKLVAIGVAVSLGGGVGMLGVRRLDDSRPVTIDEAVQRFRSASPTAEPAASATPTSVAPPSATATATPSASARPTVASTTAAGAGTVAPRAESARTPAGVYTFATTGYETADAGVPRARHDYPSETSLTVRDVPCGSSVRWDATEDRWDDVTICVSRAYTKVTAYVSYHRFFGREQTHDYTCGGTSYLRPPVTSKGYRWTFDCTTDGALARTVATVVGVESVGGARALHVHYDTTLSGSNRGTNPQDFWLALDGPYVLRQASRVDAEVDTPFGTITYHEEYDLVLKSRTPRR